MRLAHLPRLPGSTPPREMSENPPLSGLDQPSFEPGFGTRSYLAPKAELSESIDSNSIGIFSNSHSTETTRALGSLYFVSCGSCTRLPWIMSAGWIGAPGLREVFISFIR